MLELVKTQIGEGWYRVECQEQEGRYDINGMIETKAGRHLSSWTFAYPPLPLDLNLSSSSWLNLFEEKDVETIRQQLIDQRALLVKVPLLQCKSELYESGLIDARIYTDGVRNPHGHAYRVDKTVADIYPMKELEQAIETMKRLSASAFENEEWASLDWEAVHRYSNLSMRELINQLMPRNPSNPGIPFQATAHQFVMGLAQGIPLPVILFPKNFKRTGTKRLRR